MNDVVTNVTNSNMLFTKKFTICMLFCVLLRLTTLRIDLLDAFSDALRTIERELFVVLCAALSSTKQKNIHTKTIYFMTSRGFCTAEY
jgi:hypothetical protein